MSVAIHKKGEVFISASQLDTFALCERKWAWDKIGQVPRPPNEAAAWGTRIHDILERWLKHGEPPNEATVDGKIAGVGLKFLPTPSPYLRVEEWFHVQIGANKYRGKMDLSFMTQEIPWLVDHKTTGDFMWQKSEEELEHDIQATLYAKVEMDRLEVDELQLMWLYYLRRKRRPMARPTKLILTRAQVDAAFPVVDELASKITHARLNILDPRKLPVDAKACAAFGGCPYQKHCGMNARERMKAIMAQGAKKKSVREKMAEKRAKKAAELAAGGGSETPAAKPVSAPPETDGSANDTTAEAPTTPQINPPEQPAPDTQLSPEPPEEEASGTKKATKKKAAKKSKKAAAAEPTTTAVVATDGRSVFVEFMRTALAHGRSVEDAKQAYTAFAEQFGE